MRINFSRKGFLIAFSSLFLAVFTLGQSVSFAKDVSGGYTNNNWDYSLGSEYGKPAYTPLKKIESQVLYFPYSATNQQETNISSPLGSDFYVYIMPESIFEIETIELEFEKGVSNVENTIEVERLAKEIEEAIPLVFKDALKRQEEGLSVHKYGLRIKVQTAKESIDDDKRSGEEVHDENKGPKEREVDVLVNIIFGQNKIVIKIPPLKDPKEKERLIKELERITYILARQDYLIDINQVSD